MFATLDKATFQRLAASAEESTVFKKYLVYPRLLMGRYVQLGPEKGEPYLRALYEYYEQVIAYSDETFAYQVLCDIIESPDFGGYVRPFLVHFLARNEFQSQCVPVRFRDDEAGFEYIIWNEALARGTRITPRSTRQICTDLMTLIMDGKLVYTPEALADRLERLRAVM